MLDNLKPIRVKDLPTDSRQQFNEALRRVEDWKSKAPKDSLEKWDGHVDWMKAACDIELKGLPKEDKQWWCEVWASMEWFQYPENDQDDSDEDAVQQEEEGFQQEPDIQQEDESLQQEWQQQDHQGQWDQEDIEAQWGAAQSQEFQGTWDEEETHDVQETWWDAGQQVQEEDWQEDDQGEWGDEDWGED